MLRMTYLKLEILKHVRSTDIRLCRAKPRAHLQVLLQRRPIHYMVPKTMEEFPRVHFISPCGSGFLRVVPPLVNVGGIAGVVDAEKYGQTYGG